MKKNELAFICDSYANFWFSCIIWRFGIFFIQGMEKQRKITYPALPILNDFEHMI